MKRTPLSRGFLSDTINGDRYLLLARIRLLKRILSRTGRSGHLHHCRADPAQGNPWGLQKGTHVMI
jgi:hypothetical protein